MKYLAGLLGTVMLGAVTHAAVQVPPAPPPAPVADDPSLREAIKVGETCFFERWPTSVAARLGAEAATRGLSEESGSSGWLAAKGKVVDYLRARRSLIECIMPVQALQNSRLSQRDTLIWRNAIHGWLVSYEGQSRFQQRIVERLIDKKLGEEEVERPYLDPS
jgi:hypothetical protein